MEYGDSQLAFELAIKAGVLSTNPNAANYAGNYMYMGIHFGQNQFKHIDTRQYLKH